MKNLYNKSRKAVLMIAFLPFFIPIPSFAQTGYVLSLDGTAGTYMSVADHDDIDINSGESFTITCKIRTTTTLANPRILAKRNGTGGTVPGYEFISSATGQFGANLRSTPLSAGPAFSTATINNGQWRHIAMVVDQLAGNSKIYVDGVLDKTSATWTPPQDFSNAVALIIGADATATHAFNWTGQIDNIRFWSKAMSAAEVDADRSAVISGATTNLVAGWDFENISGTTVPDISGNNHPGILNGNALAGLPGISLPLQQSQLPSARGKLNQQIISVNVNSSVTGVSANLSDIKFTMAGTTNLADVTNIKIYYTGANAVFNTGTLYGSTVTAAGELQIAGSQIIASGNNYFWIAYDVAANAAEGNLLDATVESVTANATLYSPITKTMAGARTIFLNNELLFSPGDLGSISYRIPAIITAADGSLVTAVDKRNSNSGDLPNANIDIAVRRSTDNGLTWSPALIIAGDATSISYSDPSLIRDKRTGHLLCLFASGNGLFQSQPGNYIRLVYCRSMDNGLTWGAPIDITDQVYGTGCTNPITQNWYAAWPSAGNHPQLRDGRIAVAVGVRQTAGSQLDNFMIYSDDGGTTWFPSTNIAETNGDESHIVEMNNGNLLMSIRNPGSRRFNISTDKGITWGTAFTNTSFVDPNCNGDIIRYSSTLDGAPQNILLHSIPWASNRSNVSVAISCDEGISWHSRKTIFAGGSAYSSITVLPDGTIGMYYENSESATMDMYFVRFSFNWLITNATPVSGGCTLITTPLDLLSFSGTLTQNKKQALLKWTTTNEINVSRFEIEFGTNGRDFTKVGSVNANNRTTYNNYSFLHPGFPATVTTIYYRLKSLDMDGSFRYSEILRFSLAETQVTSIYPNPFTDKVIVNAPALDQTTLQVIHAGSGAVVKTMRVTNQSFTVEMGSLARGLYIVKFIRDRSVEIFKLVKQ